MRLASIRNLVVVDQNQTSLTRLLEKEGLMSSRSSCGTPNFLAAGPIVRLWTSAERELAALFRLSSLLPQPASKRHLNAEFEFRAPSRM